MRNQPWMTAVAGTAMLIASQNPLSGQTPEYGGPAAYDAIGAQYASPGGYAAAPDPSGGYGNQYAMFPQGVPDSYQPWPQLSPFEPGNVAQTSMYNKQGLWFRELLYHQRTFTGSLDAMAVVYRDAGHAVVGSAYTPLVSQGGPNLPQGQAAPFYAGATPTVGNPVAGVNGYFSTSNLIVPVAVLSTTPGLYAVFPPSGGAPIRDAGSVGKPPTTGGIKGDLGYFNEDGTGVMIGAWWGGKSDSGFSLGDEYINGVQVNQSVTQYLEGQNLTPLNGNIPLFNGEPGPVGYGAGSTAKYDVLYSLRSTTESAGANIHLYQQPLTKSDGFKLRPMWGLKYQYIGESFSFRGIDSGFNYDVDYGSTGGGTGGGSTSSTGGTNRPDPTSIIRLYDQYTAFLNSSVTSHIAGPEVGFRIDLGESSSGFKVWSETNVGIAVNSEQITLYGDNIGDPLYDVRFNGNITPRMLNPANQSAFSSQKNTAHVSPTFQQSLYADMNVIDVIPVLNKMTMFENCTFRVGYSFLWVGEVARPAETIVWQGYPMYPEINSKRSSWWMNQFNFGLNWTY